MGFQPNRIVPLENRVSFNVFCLVPDIHRFRSGRSDGTDSSRCNIRNTNLFSHRHLFFTVSLQRSHDFTDPAISNSTHAAFTAISFCHSNHCKRVNCTDILDIEKDQYQLTASTSRNQDTSSKISHKIKM